MCVPAIQPKRYTIAQQFYEYLNHSTAVLLYQVTFETGNILVMDKERFILKFSIFTIFKHRHFDAILINKTEFSGTIQHVLLFTI